MHKLMKQLLPGRTLAVRRFRSWLRADRNSIGSARVLQLALVVGIAVAVRPGQTGASPEPRRAELRDGQHDFDFEIGKWKMHLRRLKTRLQGSHEWVEFDGTSVTRPAWDGKSQVEEFEVDSPVGGHIEGMTVRLYSPTAHQWSLYWANQKNGHFDQPMVGEFKDGRGEFYDQETWEGRTILCRFVWSNTTSKSPHFEQSFSTDGGKTWEVNWITDQTRIE
jgi:hypothetical protein